MEEGTGFGISYLMLWNKATQNVAYYNTFGNHFPMVSMTQSSWSDQAQCFWLYVSHELIVKMVLGLVSTQGQLGLEELFFKVTHLLEFSFLHHLLEQDLSLFTRLSSSLGCMSILTRWCLAFFRMDTSKKWTRQKS
jgi:hypothetical protein